MINKMRIGLFFSLLIVFEIGLSGQTPDSIPPPVLNFYDAETTGAMKLNSRAPKETEQFGRFAGIWHCIQSARDTTTGEMKVRSSAFWAWKYIMDGYGVQDFWYQGENESMYWKYFRRDLILTQIRIYDPSQEKWRVAFINNHAGEVPGRVFGVFDARKEGNDMIMEFIPQDPRNPRRITFFNIKEDTFEWKVENSRDNGETWTVRSHISATKLK